jgi:hypothetical protein
LFFLQDDEKQQLLEHTQFAKIYPAAAAAVTAFSSTPPKEVMSAAIRRVLKKAGEVLPSIIPSFIEFTLVNIMRELNDLQQAHAQLAAKTENPKSLKTYVRQATEIQLA